MRQIFFKMLQVSMVFLFSASLLEAAPIPTTLPDLLKFYQVDSAQSFDAERGKEFWLRKTMGDDGAPRQCTSCHGDDLAKIGKHNKSGKKIEPMSPTVNKERYSDREKVEKWFKRNCKWTIGRECTSQEKGDVLKYLSLH